MQIHLGTARQAAPSVGLKASSGLMKPTHLARAAFRRTSAAVSAPRQGRNIVMVVPQASYSGGSYGPVGGDARIKVVGVGGGGGNAVNRMINSGLQVSPFNPIYLLSRFHALASSNHSLPAMAKNALIFSTLFAGCRILGCQHRCPGFGKA